VHTTDLLSLILSELLDSLTEVALVIQAVLIKTKDMVLSFMLKKVMVLISLALMISYTVFPMRDLMEQEFAWKFTVDLKDNGLRFKDTLDQQV